MKTILRKTLAIMLVLAMLFASAAFTSSASDENCNCGHCPSIVVPGLFQSKVRYLDENGEEMLNSQGEPYSAPFFMESTMEIVMLALEKALIPLGNLLISQEDAEERCANAIAEVLGEVLVGNLKLDEYGHPIKNIQADKYNTSFAGLTEEQRNYALGVVPLNNYVDIAGLDHLYFLSYLHTGNIIDTAKELYDLIQTAKKETGHDKVNLVPLSQGGSIENALMQLYKDMGREFSDDVNRVCYVVPAADGAYVLGDIYRYGFIDDPDALYGYMLPSLLGGDQEYLAHLISLILRIFPNADLNNILDTVVNRLIEDYLEYSTCLWGLIPSKDYPELKERFLTDPEDAHILEQTDWYYNAQVSSRQNILDAKAKGVEFFDIVDYNCANYKIFDSWNKVNGDGVIHLDSESFGATGVAVGVSLPEDYVQANTYCSDPSHNHIDEERLIDASTGILCDTTFYFKNQGHETTANNNVIMRLAIRILTDDTFKDVYSDPAFPQFNYARVSMSTIYKYNLWKDYDTSYLAPELAAEFIAARDQLGAAVESTFMPTEEFDAAAERFDAVIYKIVNGEDEPEMNFFMKLITKLLQFVNKLLLKIFGGKGFSDMLK